MVNENNIIEKLELILKKLLASNRDITIAIITTMEGLPILSILPRRYNETRISAMVATMLSLSERAIIEMEIGEFKQIFIKGNDGYLLVFDAELAVLAVSTTEKAKLGLIFLECERASHEISKILKKEK
ncbi:MAG: roadblock/LC7 domain-containing protein [Candidatus Lokiarchaeota archaeon]|nr:roadblock/LC7 domain-containing protein [Candidatus Lokiarchaeota archaeon]